MAHHYLWGSKALNIANSTIYGQERILFPSQQFDIVFLLAAAAAPPNILNYSLLRAQNTELTRGPPEVIHHFCLFIGGVHIGATALHVLNLIWFGNIARLSQWGGGG